MLQFLWVIFPYLMLTIFIVGHIYRYNVDQLSWTAKSSEFLEKKHLKWGSMLFHIGILFVFVGHVGGLLIPKSLMESLGVSESMYHAGAVYGGGLAGIITLLGILILLNRRLTNKRVRLTSDTSDLITVILIFLIILIGIYNTLIGNRLHPHFDYRETISPWFRGLLTFVPDPSLMKGVPLGFQLHILISFALIGIWPFTRLVHVWSVPLSYFKRRYIIYRKRAS
ncbi:respiratory nitrate reductase subunit gamma [Neobacillus massiliamazoniensis]|uniref:Respiratory nitrate reductase gamma chain n=1 Tax=Neobacillus massiliamazoniensis TaxID=1499688 RepID=A0A0U1NW18_9BACI|nr:respiratory nitrate reductase subunit gamma [Neobacillus massiliamazoniensis]CRK82223.1 respiratory nitrate reductase gamma chain [Neobacillus massiliamazoniensis]